MMVVAEILSLMFGILIITVIMEYAILYFKKLHADEELRQRKNKRTQEEMEKYDGKNV